MELVRLNASDFEEATDFLDFVFSSAYGPTHFKQMLPLCYQPTDEHMSHNFAVRENGRIRAIVGLFPMEIQAGETLLKLGGIGGVSSHPNDRGKGWMKLLMGRCLEEMKQTGTDLSFLTGLRQRYRYFGYEKTGMLLKYTISKTNLRHCAKEHTPEQTVRFELLEASDSERLQQVKAFYESQPCFCVRPLSTFYQYLLSMYTKPWVALYPDGKMAGYLVASPENDRITELFAEDETAFTAMVEQWVTTHGAEEVQLFLAPWQKDFARLAGAIAEDCSLLNNGNWQVFDWERVTGALLAVKQAQNGLMDGSLTVEISGYGRLHISVSGETVMCEKTSAKADFVLDPYTAMRMFFGHMPPVFIQQVPAPLQALIQSWFPLPLCLLIQNYV